MKSLIPWAVAAIFLILFVVQTCTGPDDEDHVREISKLETKIQAGEDHIRILQQRDNVRLQQQLQDSVRNAEKEKTYLAKEKKWVSQIARIKANPVVIRVREENPEVDSLINKQDSVIQDQRFRLYENGKYITQLQVEMGEIRRDFNEQIALHVQRFENEKAIADNYRDQAMKERKRGKFAKILIPIVAVGAFLAGTSL